MQLRSTNIIAGTAGEGFGMDDFALSVIPEPGSLFLAASAGLLIGRRRR
jgi:hypothetical protein